MNEIGLYYWQGRRNFGDLIAPLLLKRFARLDARWATEATADLVLIGSVLDRLSDNYRGIIAGAGKLHEHTKRTFPDARLLGFRGPLTARGFRGNFVLADPGLLADELVELPEKQYDLGLVPHWTDHDLEHNETFLRYDPLIIRVGDDPLDVIRQIGSCKKIVSSALHGIILADAFGIPRRIEIAPRMLTHAHQEGGIFKWRDYSASLGMAFEVSVTQEADRNRVVELQHELFDLFWEIRGLLRGNL